MLGFKVVVFGLGVFSTLGNFTLESIVTQGIEGLRNWNYRVNSRVNPAGITSEKLDFLENDFWTSLRPPLNFVHSSNI